MVSESQNHRLQLFTATGVRIGTLGSPGTNPGQVTKHERWLSTQSMTLLLWPTPKTVVCSCQQRLRLVHTYHTFAMQIGSYALVNGEAFIPGGLTSDFRQLHCCVQWRP